MPSYRATAGRTTAGRTATGLMMAAALAVFVSTGARPLAAAGPDADTAAAPPTAAPPAIASQSITPEQQAVADITVPPSALKVMLRVDRPDGTYEIGSVIRLNLETSLDAYVTVLNIGSDGQATVLFPNRFQPDNRVVANRTVLIPGEGSGSVLRIGGPAGSDVIKVLASTENIPLLDKTATAPAGDYQVATQSAGDLAGAVQMSIGLSQAVAEGGRAGVQWGMATRQVRVIPAAAAAAPDPGPAPGSLPGPAPGSGATLTIRTDKAVYRIGEPINVQVRSTGACFLTLVNLDAAGKARVLFPHPQLPDNRIAAGQTLLIPGQTPGVVFRAEGPAGPETITAVCRADPAPAGADAQAIAQAVGVHSPEAPRTDPARAVGMATAGFQVVGPP